MQVSDHKAKPIRQPERQMARKLTFDSDSLVGVDPFEAMSEFSQGLYQYSMHASQAGSSERPYLRLNAWLVGGVAAASFEHSAMTVDGSHNIDPDLQDHVLLRVVKRGKVPLQSGDDETVMVPGQIYIYHPNNVLLPSQEGASIGLRLPRSAINYNPSYHRRILAFDNENPIGRVVGSAIASLFGQLPSISEDQAQIAGPMICNMVRALLSAAPVDEETYASWHNARDQSMRTFLLENLKDPEIGTAQLMARFGASRATIYRSFSDDGGVISFIRDQRLQAINRELRKMPYSYGCVRRVSERYGFTDQSIFTKSFKRHFVLRPSEVVGTGSFRLDDRAVDAKNEFSNLPKLASFWSAA